MRTGFLWRLTGLSALASSLFLAAGLVWAVADILHPPAAGPDDPAAVAGDGRDGPEPDKEDKHLDIVALGDSLTTGMGDHAGLGYVGRLKNRLEEAGDRPVRLLNNLAVNGYRTDQLLADLDKPSVAAAIRNADLILLTIGGNDLFRSLRDGLDAPDGLTVDGLRAAVREPAERLGRILDRLAAIRPEALVVCVGLYNPFADLDGTRETSAAVAEWNAAASRHALRHPNVLFVPVADLFERHPERYLYTDHFHPNAEGYERIAERVFRALE